MATQQQGAVPSKLLSLYLCPLTLLAGTTLPPTSPPRSFVHLRGDRPRDARLGTGRLWGAGNDTLPPPPPVLASYSSNLMNESRSPPRTKPSALQEYEPFKEDQGPIPLGRWDTGPGQWLPLATRTESPVTNHPRQHVDFILSSQPPRRHMCSTLLAPVPPELKGSVAPGPFQAQVCPPNPDPGRRWQSVGTLRRCPGPESQACCPQHRQSPHRPRGSRKTVNTVGSPSTGTPCGRSALRVSSECHWASPHFSAPQHWARPAHPSPSRSLVQTGHRQPLRGHPSLAGRAPPHLPDLHRRRSFKNLKRSLWLQRSHGDLSPAGALGSAWTPDGVCPHPARTGSSPPPSLSRTGPAPPGPRQGLPRCLQHVSPSLKPPPGGQGPAHPGHGQALQTPDMWRGWKR